MFTEAEKHYMDAFTRSGRPKALQMLQAIEMERRFSELADSIMRHLGL